MVTTLFINFSDAQGQLTPKSVMEPCRNSNPSKLLKLVLLSARMKKIHPKIKFLEWSQRFSHYKSMGIFPDAQGQLTHKSLVGSCRISNPFGIIWLSLLPARIKKNKSKMKELEWSQDFPHYNPMGAIWSDLTQNLLQSIPHPNDASDEIWLWLVGWFQRYSCLKVWTHRRMDARTDGRQLESHTISSPWAFGSGELKMGST